MTFDEVTIIRSKRRSLAIEIGRDGRIVMRAPHLAPQSLLKRFFDEKKTWIKKHQTAQQERALKSMRYFQPGEIFHYLGEEYILRTRETGRRFELIDAFYIHQASTHQAKKLLENWYKKRARQLFTERLDTFSQQMGLPYERLRLSSASTRWGSCRGACINLTWRLIMAPPAVIDSVVIHELAHIRHKNHGKAFWQLVLSHCPDYKKHDRWLKQNEHLLAW